jgi:hypothetical protein
LSVPNCPQWREELQTKFNIPAKIAIGKDLLEAEPKDEVGAVITTYHSARLYIHRLPPGRFQMLVLDEAPVACKVYVIVNYDNFTILPDVTDDYASMVHDLVERFYSGVTRYTTSGFLRAKLGDALQHREVAPHIYESADEARAFTRAGAGSDRLSQGGRHLPGSLGIIKAASGPG